MVHRPKVESMTVGCPWGSPFHLSETVDFYDGIDYHKILSWWRDYKRHCFLGGVENPVFTDGFQRGMDLKGM